MTHEATGPTNSLPLHSKAQLSSQVANHSQWSYDALAIYPGFLLHFNLFFTYLRTLAT